MTTETESITNRVFEGLNVRPEVAALGRLAAKDELSANDPGLPEWAREIYQDYARREREAQLEILTGTMTAEGHPHSGIAPEGQGMRAKPVVGRNVINSLGLIVMGEVVILAAAIAGYLWYQGRFGF